MFNSQTCMCWDKVIQKRVATGTLSFCVERNGKKLFKKSIVVIVTHKNLVVYYKFSTEYD